MNTSKPGEVRQPPTIEELLERLRYAISLLADADAVLKLSQAYSLLDEVRRRP